MTRYEQLAELAVEIALRFNQTEELCQTQAQAIAGRLAFLLESPDGRIVTVDLDGDLKATGKTHELYDRPEVVHWTDGRWYFGIRIKYQMRGPLSDYLQETPIFSIRLDDPKNSSFGVRQLEGTEREITSTDDLDGFLRGFIAESEARLCTGFRRRPIGFGFVN